MQLLKILFALFLVCSSGSFLYAQRLPADSLQLLVQQYRQSSPAQVLYVVTDKDVYVPGETIWIAGYLLDRWATTDSTKADILCVGLKDMVTGKTSLKRNFLIQKGIGSGSWQLPDTLPPGHYELLCASNLMNADSLPQQVFSKRITIGLSYTPPYTTAFTTMPSKNPDEKIVAVQVRGNGGNIVGRQAKLHYALKGGRSKMITIDEMGRCLITLTKTEIELSDSVLYTTTIIDKNAPYTHNIPLTTLWPKDSLQIRFYPESGYLVNGLESRVGWEAKQQGSPVSVKAALFQNNTIIDTIHTATNGLGVFTMLPQPGAVYHIAILDDANAPQKKFFLPAPLAEGAVLHLPQAITDSLLSVQIATSQKGVFHIGLRQLINNETNLIGPFEIDKVAQFKISIGEAQRGLIAITLIDQQGRPVAERLCFAHYNHKPIASIEPDKERYSTRDSITILPTLKNARKTPVAGIYTISCSQLTRMDTATQHNMADYFYLNYWLNSSSPKAAINMEDLLLVKGWRRYTWQLTEKNTGHSLFKAPLVGQLKVLEKNKKPQYFEDTLTLHISRGNTITDSVLISAKEPFALTPAQIATPEGNALFIKPTGKYVGGSKVVMKDINTLLLSSIKNTLIHYEHSFSNIRNLSPTIISGEGVNGVAQLATVVVKARTNQPTVSTEFGANECGDYECAVPVSHYYSNEPDRYYKAPPGRYLNDPGCPVYYRRKPIKGKAYYILNSARIVGYCPAPGNAWLTPQVRVEALKYEGCALEGIHSEGIYTTREFYGMESEMFKSDEKAFLSTIYWNPFVVYDPADPQPIKFYTSDQTGAYKITIQGVTATGEVFYADKIIRVQKTEEN